ncbi:MAG: hypothetical protein ACXW23_19545 [Telluria sp.]
MKQIVPIVEGDGDDDCPVSKAAEIQRRAQPVIAHQPLSVILANREYEAWFIAAAAPGPRPPSLNL